MMQQTKVEEIDPNYVCEACGYTLEPLKCKCVRDVAISGLAQIYFELGIKSNKRFNSIGI